jgi:hypothetical protein
LTLTELVLALKGLVPALKGLVPVLKELMLTLPSNTGVIFLQRTNNHDAYVLLLHSSCKTCCLKAAPSEDESCLEAQRKGERSLQALKDYIDSRE